MAIWFFFYYFNIKFYRKIFIKYYSDVNTCHISTQIHLRKKKNCNEKKLTDPELNREPLGVVFTADIFRFGGFPIDWARLRERFGATGVLLLVPELNDELICDLDIFFINYLF